MVNGPLIEPGRYPFPYQAAFTVASDIDSASPARFRAIHALICGTGVIRPECDEWQTLGLTDKSRWFDESEGGFRGLGLDLADSFFLAGDATSFGMYRYEAGQKQFLPDIQDGEDCARLVRGWIQSGQIDCYHSFLHYTRDQVKPLLEDFYRWCEREGVRKPLVWTNHSAGVTPSGLCPEQLQCSRIRRLVGLAARGIAGPALGRKRHPLRQAFVRYRGDSPGSPYYVNDLLAANGLRYVWLNHRDLYRNQICLPWREHRGRFSVLDIVRMDDGVRYYRFARCYGRPSRSVGEGMYLADSEAGYDTSCLISENNLRELCERGGTCILTTHWAHCRSMPVSDETLGRFHLLRQWRDARRIWVVPTARLLEWTRRRTFLDYTCTRLDRRILIEINGIDDPIFGRERVEARDLHGLCFHLAAPECEVQCVLQGMVLDPSQVQRAGDTIWLSTDPAEEPSGANEALAMGAWK